MIAVTQGSATDAFSHLNMQLGSSTDLQVRSISVSVLANSKFAMQKSQQLLLCFKCFGENNFEVEFYSQAFPIGQYTVFSLLIVVFMYKPFFYGINF